MRVNTQQFQHCGTTDDQLYLAAETAQCFTRQLDPRAMPALCSQHTANNS